MSETVVKMNDVSYKTQHELFVSGHHGASWFEPFCILTLVPLTTSLSLFISNFTLQSVIITLSLLLSTTILEDYIILFLGLCIFITIFIADWKKFFDNSIYKPCGHLPMITNFRAATNLVSTFCILAVDFRIFPRKLAKTEAYGYGLMDLGVGFFMVANGLVAKSGSGQLKKTFKGFWPANDYLLFSTYVYCMLKCLGCLILTLLGVARVLLTRGVDYHEHITEYGTQWNFFFTLACCQMLHFILDKLVPLSSLTLAILIISFHEILLKSGLEQYALSDSDRINFFSKNREGLTSIMGYLGLLYAAQASATILNQRNKQLNQYLYCFLLSVALAIPLYFFEIRPSRRTVNLGFMLWVLSQSFFCLGLFSLLECVSSKRTVPKLFEAINRNGLEFFLMGNLLTGLCNLVFWTITMGPISSLLLLKGYLLLLCSFVFLRDRIKIGRMLS